MHGSVLILSYNSQTMLSVKLKRSFIRVPASHTFRALAYTTALSGIPGADIKRKGNNRELGKTAT